MYGLFLVKKRARRKTNIYSSEINRKNKKIDWKSIEQKNHKYIWYIEKLNQYIIGFNQSNVHQKMITYQETSANIRMQSKIKEN